MKLLLPEVDYKLGFSEENDIFDRKRLARQLESIIAHSDDDSLVLALDDQWGNGKTTFLKLWESELLNNDNFDVVYFDAFKNDYQDDAFLALSSAIYPRINNEKDKQKYINAAKGVGKFILKTSVKIGLRAATLGAVKDTDFEGLDETIKGTVEEPIEKIIEEKLKNAEQEQITIQYFKETITNSANNKKIIFIIDELDRARPDFSLDLLEKIKHVFNTKKLFFVLAMNKEQFKNTIQKRYGNIDAETYLSKFIHFWFSLPHPRDTKGEVTTIENFLSHINQKMKINPSYDTSLVTLTNILRATNASLRDCERCYSLMMLIVASKPRMEKPFQLASAMLVYLKTKHPFVFENLKSGNSDIDSVTKPLNISAWKDTKADYIHKLIRTDLYSNDRIMASANPNTSYIFDQFGMPVKVFKDLLPYFESVISI
ncbi:P-loop NTPase fold protein [Pantoea sp.]|uniref:KAP family P-loop NTPase fold protein n=1 Tax=Pantoea sp. TaxID=69393 RepID=UPI0028A59E91|nr:P-loop NTPase fold protein [Pantoea sp.]